ncbi:hypothetical protein ATCC90586_004471 [Pythium insidiosum]|nr:hypothetical protein ATCC90586_004471 [Pythium insidiosum]
MLSTAARRLTRASLSAQRSVLVARSMHFNSVITMQSSEASLDIFTPTEEHGALREMLQNFVKTKVEPQALEHDRDEKFNINLFRELGDIGLLGITAQEKYGGSEMDALAAVIAHEELSSSDPAFCLSFLAHSMLFVNNVARNASDAQCQKYLPGACSGEKICGMAMSEPSVGTDVLGMRTTAKLSDCGKYYILNGTKMWITNGALNDHELGDAFLVYARTGNSGKAKHDFSSFIVEKGFEGFSLGQRIKDKCGMRASNTAELVFENCKVPVENLVGKEGGAVLCMMRNLEIERVTLAAMSLGIARRSIEVMNSYAKDRVAFGQSLNQFGQIQKNIAESYAEYMAGRTYVYNTARSLQLDSVGNRLDTDGVKLYCGDMAKRIADRAIQTLGGYGYVGEYNVERLWRDSKLLEIGGGTNESHHKNMVRDLVRKQEETTTRPALSTIHPVAASERKAEKSGTTTEAVRDFTTSPQKDLPEATTTTTVDVTTVHVSRKRSRPGSNEPDKTDAESTPRGVESWDAARGSGSAEPPAGTQPDHCDETMAEQPHSNDSNCSTQMTDSHNSQGSQEDMPTTDGAETGDDAAQPAPAFDVQAALAAMVPKEVAQYSPLLIGKYYIQDKRAVWAGRWGMTEAAFAENGVTSAFEMKSEEDVVIHPAVRSGMPFDAKYSGFFQIQVVKGKPQTVAEKDVEIRPFKMEDLTEEELNEPMTQADKARLSADIRQLPQDKINRVLQIIAESVPVSKLANDNDEVEIDINSFDTRCLRMLEGYVRNAGGGKTMEVNASQVHELDKKFQDLNEEIALALRHQENALSVSISAAAKPAGTPRKDVLRLARRAMDWREDVSALAKYIDMQLQNSRALRSREADVLSSSASSVAKNPEDDDGARMRCLRSDLRLLQGFRVNYANAKGKLDPVAAEAMVEAMGAETRQIRTIVDKSMKKEKSSSKDGYAALVVELFEARRELMGKISEDILKDKKQLDQEFGIGDFISTSAADDSNQSTNASARAPTGSQETTTDKDVLASWDTQLYLRLVHALLDLQAQMKERFASMSVRQGHEAQRAGYGDSTGDGEGEGDEDQSQSQSQGPARGSGGRAAHKDDARGCDLGSSVGPSVRSDAALDEVNFMLQKLRREMAELKSSHAKMQLVNSQLEDDLAHLQRKYEDDKRAHVSEKKWYGPKIQKLEETIMLTSKAFEGLKLNVELITNMYKTLSQTLSTHEEEENELKQERDRVSSLLSLEIRKVAQLKKDNARKDELVMIAMAARHEMARRATAAEERMRVLDAERNVAQHRATELADEVSVLRLQLDGAYSRLEATDQALRTAKLSIEQLHGEIEVCVAAADAKQAELKVQFEKELSTLQQRYDKTKRELMETMSQNLSLDGRLRKAQEKLTRLSGAAVAAPATATAAAATGGKS